MLRKVHTLKTYGLVKHADWEENRSSSHFGRLVTTQEYLDAVVKLNQTVLAMVVHRSFDFRLECPIRWITGFL